MSDVRPHGHRRIDRVLADDFVADLPGMTMEELRHRRREAEQEEADLSYVRRLLQGRIDVLRERLSRDSAGDDSSLVEHLPEVLDDHPAAPHGLGRHIVVEPSNVDDQRRRAEVLLADVDMSNTQGHTDEELRRALGVFAEEERRISANRRAVQEVMDLFGAEIARRYRDGEANVSDLLEDGGRH